MMKMAKHIIKENKDKKIVIKDIEDFIREDERLVKLSEYFEKKIKAENWLRKINKDW